MADEKKISETQPAFEVNDKRPQPEGAVPKQAQSYVIAGLAVLILVAVLFSNRHPSPAQKVEPLVPSSISTDANQRKIAELEQDLSAEQRQMQAQSQSQRMPSVTSATSGSPSSSTNTEPLQPQSVQAPTEPRRDPVSDAERELAFKSRFASNLVHADDRAHRSDLASHYADSAGHANPEPDSPRPSDLLPYHAPASQVAGNEKKHTPEVNVASAHGKPYVLFEGTTIDTALVNRMDGEFSGPVKVMVTNPVYSQDRQHVLVPEGTFLLGDVQKVSGFGQKRLAVTFHRMLMPDGYPVDLDQFHGLDQAGETGLKGKVNNHYLEIFGASIALGVIAGAAESTTYGGYTENGSDMYRQGMASSLSQSASTVLDRFINVPPTITIREGHRIKVYLTQDLLLPAYENHDMPGDL